MDVGASFGEWIAQRRKALHLSQRELAQQVNCAEITLRKIEADERRPSSQMAEALAGVLTLSPAEHAIFVRVARGERVVDYLPDPTGPALRWIVGQAPEQAAKTLRRQHLPTQLTHWIGRRAEMERVERLALSDRLVTLIGAGGVGKTRLAIEVANKITQAFSDHVWFVDLAPLNNPDLIANTIVSALGLRATSQLASALLLEHLREKHMLLVIDNCEHLIDACAFLTESLLRACPQLHVLATSREPLNIPGETTWRVPSLSNRDGVDLFIDRASYANPDLEFTPQNKDSAESICQQLDNIPLAIELATSQLRSHTLTEIAAGLNERFRHLTGGARTALPRHQTLRALIDWSYGLLSENEQRLLRWTSVFAGGFTPDMAEAVCGMTDAVVGLQQLVNKSLITYVEDADQPRYTVLETIRHYGHEKLIETGEMHEARQAHLNFILEMAESARHDERNQKAKWWEQRIRVEWGNWRVAMETIVEQQNIYAAQLLVSRSSAYLDRLAYYREGVAWFERMLRLAHPDDTRLRMNCLNAIGNLSIQYGDNVRAESASREVLPIANVIGNRHMVLESELRLGYVTADYVEANHLFENCLRTMREKPKLRSENLEKSLLHAMAHQAYAHGDLDKAHRLFTQALEWGEQHRDERYISAILYHLGMVELQRGNAEAARVFFQDSIARNRALAGSLGNPYALIELAQLEIEAGLWEDATTKLLECMDEFDRIGNIDRLAHCISIGAWIAQCQSNLACAARLMGKTAQIQRDHSTHGIYARDMYRVLARQLPVLKATMDPSEFTFAFVYGEHMTVSQAMEEVRNL